jgi:hypothetical protein
MRNKKTSKLKNILSNSLPFLEAGVIVAGLSIGSYKCADWYLDGALPDIKQNSEWKSTYFNTEADLGSFLYNSHKKEGGKFVNEGLAKHNYSLSVCEYNQENGNDPKLTGEIYLPDTNKDGKVGPGENW